MPVLYRVDFLYSLGGWILRMVSEKNLSEFACLHTYEFVFENIFYFPQALFFSRVKLLSQNLIILTFVQRR